MAEVAAGERGAILYTVIESCRYSGLDPYAYLKDLLSRLPSMTNHQVPEVTPEAWNNPPPGRALTSIVNVRAQISDAYASAIVNLSRRHPA